MLKTVAYATAGVVLVSGTVWVLTRHRGIAALEKETLALEKRLADSRTTKAAGSSCQVGAKETLATHAFDWRGLFAELEKGANPKRETYDRFGKALQRMNPDELVTVLHEVIGRELPESRKMSLTRLAGRFLVEKDPVRGLETLGSSAFASVWKGVSESGILWYGLGKWADKDKDAACAWLDRMIAEERFADKSLDQVNKARLGFEKVLAGRIWEADPERMRKRLYSLSEEETKQVLSSLGLRVPDGHWKPYAALARDCLPEHESNKQIAQIVWLKSKHDYAQTTQILDDIEASPVERIATTERAANSQIFGPRHEDPADLIPVVDRLREWGLDQHPDIDRLTGSELSNLIDWALNFEQVAEVVIHCHEKSGRDEVLLGFFSGKARHHGDAARKLAERISDPEVRAAVLETIH